jgi:type II secretion system protein H
MHRPPASPPRRRSGYSLIELMIVIVLIAVLAAVSTPLVSQALEQSKITRASQVLAADLEVAFSLATRFQQPMRVAVDNTTKRLVVSDRAGAVRYSRAYGADSEFGIEKISAMMQNGSRSATLEILPSGVSSGQYEVIIQKGKRSKTVRIARGGHVRVLP